MTDKSKTLPTTYHQGYCYFDVNTGKFWIDTTNAAAGRMAINAYKSDKATLSDAAIYETTEAVNAPLHKINTYYGHGLSLDGTTLSLVAGDNNTSLSSISLPNPDWDSITNKPDVFPPESHTHTTEEILPIKSKTFTNVIGTENTWAKDTFFFGSIRPASWYTIWRVKYRIRTYVPGKNGYDQVADVMISGDQDALRSYSSMNTVSPSYPAYYHELYRLKSAGFNNGYGHSLGVRFYSAYSPTDTNYKRTIVVDILELENCTFDFYDSCLLYANIPGTGSTNYNTYSELNYCSNGLQESGDSNDPNYQNRIYYTSSIAKDQIYRYQLLLRTIDEQLIPVSTANNSFTIGKTYTTTPFNPFGEIYYYNSTSSIAPNGNIGNYSLYRQVLADLRYSFDLNNSTNYKLIARQPVYLTATLQSDGSAVLTVPTGSTIGPLAQSLPTTEDGLIYIYLGQAYEDTYPYRVELVFNHGVYYYKNGQIRKLTGDAQSVNGYTIESNIPADAVFTDTHYTTHLYAGDGTAANKATTNNNTKISVADNSTVRNSITIKGSGTTSVTSDANGVITISSADSKTGTVTKVSTGVGLTGGDITGTGTIKAKLKTETAFTADSAAQTNTADRQYMVGVDKSGYLSVNVPWGNTDTKVTSVENHYTPTANTDAELTVDASSTTAATWNSTSLVTGVNIQRDAKGHVTGVTVDSIKMPANPNSNTATAADNILDGSNSGTQITYAPYTAQQSKLSFDTSTTAPTRTDRLNLNGYLYATKLYSGGNEVLTSHQSLSGYIPKSTLSGAYDIMYSSAANTPTRLAANTTTTKKFLSMTGTGSAGAAPSWASVTKGDVGLGNVENTALSSWTGSNKITTLGTIGTGTWQGSTIGASYLPTATTTAKGIVQIGSGLSVSNGTISVNISDLGLSSAMHFKGTTTTAMSDGLTTAAVTIDGNLYTPSAGDVVLYSDSEFLWTGSAWERLGRDSSFKTTQTAVSSPSASGSTTAFIDTISQNANGVITVTKKNLDTSGTWSGNAATATTATNLSAKPSLATSGNNITVTAGGKTSDAFTVPYATSAASATKLGSSTIGSNVKAIYLNNGTPTASDHEFAGGYQKNNADLNTLYDAGFYSSPGGGATNYPANGNKYAAMLVVPYRKPSGNTTPDYAFQIGNFTQANDRLWYRTSNSTTWRDWRNVVNIAANTAVGGTTTPVYVDAHGTVTALSYTIAKSVPSNAVFTDTDTKNTAGSTDTSSKIFLVGATSQAANPQTYSDNQVYATNGQLDANKVRIAEAVSLVYDSTTQALNFVFA